MPEQRFSIGESCALLDIDRVTLSRWLAAEHMSPQSDVRDRRYKYLTREQIQHLATVHDKVVRDEPLKVRLTGVQREFLANQERMKEDIELLIRQHADLRRQFDDLLGRNLLVPRPSYTPPEAHQTPLLPESTHEYPTVPRASDFEYSALEGRPRRSRTGRVFTRRSEALQPGEYHRLPPIPAGWRTPGEMADELGKHRRTFLHHLLPRDAGDRERQYGTLAYHAGRWQGRHPGTLATELLDLEQQDAARAQFSRRQGGDVVDADT